MTTVDDNTVTVEDNTFNSQTQRAPLVTGSAYFTSVTEDVSQIAERYRPPRSWYISPASSILLTSLRDTPSRSAASAGVRSSPATVTWTSLPEARAWATAWMLARDSR